MFQENISTRGRRMSIESYIIFAAVVFFSAFFGNILGQYIREWYQDRMLDKAFESIQNRRN